ncbi:MAG: coproporphyrinogen III oxidase, partial [Bacteroidaceae bacterium]|nr:coproporphyrinogen III oxidase [Bacteroidaceae bacterium]
MAGVYVHIPFCKSRCIYCDFFSTTSLPLREKYVDALCREIELRSQGLSAEERRIETIYLGGGTPS